MRACLNRIAAREADIRAWVHLDPEPALRQARARDAEPPHGPLHGVPVGIKDLMDTADMPTTYGSRIYAEHQPARDAVCVARLREAGAVILGKTVTTEFALVHPGPTRNPHDQTRTPGGSSSGSAAAVADRMVPVAVGTQTAGSVVRPASFCGIYGYKPTLGLIPTGGVKPCAPSLDTVGVFARSVEDLAATATAMAASEVGVGPPPRTIGFVPTHEWAHADAYTRTAIRDLAAKLAAPELRLPEAFSSLVTAHDRLNAREATASLRWERTQHPEECSPELLAMLERGDQMTDADAAAALQRRDVARRHLAKIFAEYDALLAPAVLGEAPAGLVNTGDPLFCRMWTLLGNPCVAVPGLRGEHGLPLGVQVVTPFGRDSAALGAARWVADHIEPSS